MELIKTTISLKIEIKENITFLWFDPVLYTIIKTYISSERAINAGFDKTNYNFIHCIIHKLWGNFVLACMLQEAFQSTFKWSYLQR